MLGLAPKIFTSESHQTTFLKRYRVVLKKVIGKPTAVMAQNNLVHRKSS